MEGNQPIKIMGQNGFCLPLEMCDGVGQAGLFMQWKKMTLSYQEAEKDGCFLGGESCWKEGCFCGSLGKEVEF